MDTAPPSSRVHHPHSRPLYSPQFRKDLSKKETDQQTCLCPCRELGFMNLGISRCFEILSWHIRSLRSPKEQHVWGKNAGSKSGRFHFGFHGREGPGNGSTNLGVSKDFSSRTCKICLSRNFKTLIGAAKSWICGSFK